MHCEMNVNQQIKKVHLTFSHLMRCVTPFCLTLEILLTLPILRLLRQERQMKGGTE